MEVEGVCSVLLFRSTREMAVASVSQFAVFLLSGERFFCCDGTLKFWM
jgi:hypothetical protein